MNIIGAVEAKKIPRLPTLDKVRKQYNIVWPVLEALQDCENITPSALHQTAEELHRILSTRKDIFHSFLSGLIGQVPDRGHLNFLARRLVGNLHRVQRGLLMSPDSKSAASGWNYGRLVDIEDLATQRGARKKLVFLVEVGAWAGSEVAYVLSPKGLFIIACNIGFSRYRQPLKYRGIRGLMRLRAAFCVKHDP